MTRHRRDEGGTMLVEFTWLGILLLIPLLYVLLSVFEVQRGAFAVTAASRAAGRAWSVADQPHEARQRAEAAVRLALRDQGMDPRAHDLEVSCQPRPHDCLSPGSTVTVTVTSQVALPLMPSFLRDSPPSVRVEATHSVPRGRYRSN